MPDWRPIPAPFLCAYGENQVLPRGSGCMDRVGKQDQPAPGRPPAQCAQAAHLPPYSHHHRRQPWM